MDRIKKYLLLDYVLLNALDTTEIANKAREYHDLSDCATDALAKTLTMGAFMSVQLKGADEKMSIVIDGNGSVGKITVAAMSGGKVRGTVDYPQCINTNGQRSVVGNEGNITVIKDLGLKEPYVGKCEIATGDIAKDFALYFVNSEQVPTAIALGVKIENGKVKASGGFIAQLLPNCPDEIITILEDIFSKFTDVGSLIADRGIEQIINDEFSHFKLTELLEIPLSYTCTCSRERSERLIISLGKKEAENIINEQGSIDIKCDFCDRVYSFNADDVKSIFDEVMRQRMIKVASQLAQQQSIPVNKKDDKDKK